MAGSQATVEVVDSTPTAPPIACRALVKCYGPLRAVDGVDITVWPGECFGLLGPNGAGKTTTVEILEGLGSADGGVVELFGTAWGAGRDQALRQHIGIQLQESQLADKLTVFEVVRLFRSFYARGHSVEQVINWVQLEAKRDARVGKLSGGQKQRLALACALAGAPDILFLDEPTTGLDPQARMRVWEVVEAFKQRGGTVVLTTHYMEEAARLCDRLAVMDSGKIIAEGTPRALIAQLDAEQIIDLSCTPALSEKHLIDLPGVTGVDHQSDKIILRVTDVGTAVPALMKSLESNGATLTRLGTHAPTLEDVFVHLTGKALRDG